MEWARLAAAFEPYTASQSGSKLAALHTLRAVRGFPAVFGGMINDLSTDAPPKQFFNPERIGSVSPRLARFEEGLPWVAAVVSGYP
jgi:hypothetical protein